MLSEHDFYNCLAEACDLESRMVEVYAAILGEIEDDRLREMFRRLLADEAAHVGHLRHLERLHEPPEVEHEPVEVVLEVH
jgi:rubrerythrin